MKCVLLILLIQKIGSLLFTTKGGISLIEFWQIAQNHFAHQKSLTIEAWNSSLPTQEEKQEMRALLTRLYYMPTFEGYLPPLEEYPALIPWINITRAQNYLIIHEQIPKKDRLFPRNWGFLALCDPKQCSRIIHHSAVHFDSEGPIYEEALQVAQNTRSRSVTLHGVCRYSLKENVPSSCQPKYTATDGAHNDNTMFHLWSSTLLELSRSRNEDYTFVQWHGMAETSCSLPDVFLSIGSSNSDLYISSKALTAKNIFNSIAAPLVCVLPPDQTDCKLVASDNPLGRLINGVPPDQVCSEKAKDENVKGRFLHIEQKEKAREAIQEWTEVFKQTFLGQ